MPASRRASLRASSFLRNCLVTGSLLTGSLGLAAPAFAQDSAFLACARFDDRGQRIACLEDALEAAVAAPAGVAGSAPAAPAAAPAPPAVTVAPAAPAVPAAPAAAGQAPTAVAPATATTQDSERSLLDRIRNFGQDEPAVSVSIGDNGEDRLHDSITSLEKRNNLWIVTLSSGQVWRQTYPRNLLLREGDDISIDQEGIGSSFRLSTPRLSGFIRVERVK